ncbi:MAG: PKD domain-containing protein [Candidatus Bathyarchaeia archaeon]
MKKLEAGILVTLILLSTFTFLYIIPKSRGVSVPISIFLEPINAAEIIGETDDGNYTKAHTTATGIYEDTTYVQIGQYYEQGGVYAISRAFFLFNTSSIPSPVIAAYFTFEESEDYSDNDFTIRIQKWTGDVPFDFDDYNMYDGINYDDGSYNTEDFDFRFVRIPIVNLSLINPGGATYLCLRSENDINAIPPELTEAIGISNPRLEIVVETTIEGGSGLNYISMSFEPIYLDQYFFTEFHFSCAYYNGTGKTKVMELIGVDCFWQIWIRNETSELILETTLKLYEQETPVSSDLISIDTSWHYIYLGYYGQFYGPDYIYIRVDDEIRFQYTIWYTETSFDTIQFGSIDCIGEVEETFYLFFFDYIVTPRFTEDFESPDWVLNWNVFGDCAIQPVYVYEGNYSLQVPLSIRFTAFVTPEVAYILFNHTIQFTCTPYHGFPPYQYEWYLDGRLVATNSPTFMYYANETGIFSLWCNVTDTTNNVAKSNVVIITVSTSFFNVTISPAEATISVEQHVTFTSNVEGATPPLTYQWYIDATPVSGANTSTFTFLSRTPGRYYVSLQVIDSEYKEGWSEPIPVTVIAVKEHVNLARGNPWLIGGLNGQLEAYRNGQFYDYCGLWTRENITHICAKEDEYVLVTEHTLKGSTRWANGFESGNLTEFGENLPQGGIIIPSNFVIKTEDFENFNPNEWTIVNQTAPPYGNGLKISPHGYNETIAMNSSAQYWYNAETNAYISRDVNAPVVTVTCLIRINDVELNWQAYGYDHVCLISIDNGAAGVWLYYYYVGDSLYIYKLKATLGGAWGNEIELLGGTVGLHLGQWYKVTFQYRKDSANGWLLAWIDGEFKGALTGRNTGTGNITNVKVGVIDWLVYVPYCYVDASFDNINITGEALCKTGYQIVSSPTRNGNYALAVYSDGFSIPPLINHTEPYAYYHIAMEADVYLTFIDKPVNSFAFFYALENRTTGAHSFMAVYVSGNAYESAGYGGPPIPFQPNVWHHVTLEIKVTPIDELLGPSLITPSGWLKITVDGQSVRCNLPWGATVDDKGVAKFGFGLYRLNYPFPPNPISFFPSPHSSHSFILYFDNLKIYTTPVQSAQLLIAAYRNVKKVSHPIIDAYLGTDETSWKYRRVIIGDVESCGDYWLIGGGYCPNLDSEGPFWIPFLIKIDGRKVIDAFQGINYRQILQLPFGDWYTGGWVTTITYCDTGTSSLVGKAVIGFTVQDYFIHLRWYSGYGGLIATYDGRNLQSHGTWYSGFGGGGYPTASAWDGENVLIGDAFGNLILWDGVNHEKVGQTNTRILDIEANKFKEVSGWFENGVWRKYFLAVDGEHLFKIENKSLDDLTDLIGSDAKPVCVGFNGEYFLIGGDKLIAKGCYVDLTNEDFITTKITALDCDIPALPMPAKGKEEIIPEEEEVGIKYCLPLMFWILMIIMFIFGLILYSQRKTWITAIPLIPIILWLLIFQPKIPVEQMPIAFLRIFTVPPWHLYMAVILTFIAAALILTREKQ